MSGYELTAEHRSPGPRGGGCLEGEGGGGGGALSEGGIGLKPVGKGWGGRPRRRADQRISFDMIRPLSSRMISESAANPQQMGVGDT